MEQDIDKYKTYTAIDFVLDENFVSWVQKPTSDSNRYWTNVLETSSKLYNIIDEARFVVLNLKITTNVAKPKDIEKIWEDLKIAHQNAYPHFKKEKSVYSLFSGWKAIAASIIITIGVSSLFFYQNHRPTTIPIIKNHSCKE